MQAPKSPAVEHLFKHPLEGRYQIVKVLKASGGITTCLAEDLAPEDPQAHGQVIIKYVAAESITQGSLARLEHEAAIFTELRLAGIGAILHLGRDAEAAFLVMPYVAGITLGERLRRGPLTTAEGLCLGIELAQAVARVHAQGILHRDIKPSNIIITDSGDTSGGPAFTATLIDFGLARSTLRSSSVGEACAFTAYYAAPEQTGLIDHGTDERSDLYALGIVLYEALAGHVPFAGQHLNEVLLQHLSASPPSLCKAAAGTPPVVEEVIFRLLAKDPRDRYQSASSLAHDLSALMAARLQGYNNPSLSLGNWDRRDSLTEPSFIGRTEELAALVEVASAAAHGKGGLLLLEAPSGAGKSRLLDELARLHRDQSVLVLRGQGVDHTAHRPFQVLAGVARSVVAAAHLDASFKKRLGCTLHTYAPSLAALLPELNELFTVTTRPEEAPEAYGESRSIAALSAFLNTLGTAERRVLILIDDAQWADSLSLKLLHTWNAEANASRYTSIIRAYRSEEATPTLKALSSAPAVVLPPFNQDELACLLTSMAGTLPPAAVSAVAELSANNAFMATAVLRGMVESGALLPSNEGWYVVAEVLNDLQSSRRAAAILTRRLESFPPQVLDFLSVGAVLGKTFSLTQATQLAQHSPAAAAAAVALARRCQILWQDAAGELCRFVHDKLREALISRLPPQESQRLHKQAALYIEASNPSADFDLAYHFDAAGQSARAVPHALKAAKQARAQSALTIAEAQYRIAERGFATLQPEGKALVAKGLGEVLMLQGRYQEAQQQMEQARAFALDTRLRAGIETSLGELLFKRGDMQEAVKALSRALKLLGRMAPASAASFVFLLAWEIAVQTGHSLFPQLTRRRKRPLDPDTALALRIYSRLAYAYWFTKGRLSCAWAHLRNMNMAERFATSPELAQAYSEHSPVLTTLPWFSRGIKYVRRSLSIRRQFKDVWGQGQSLNFYGIALYSSSQYEETITRCQEAKRLLERTGDRWEANTADWHIAYSHYRLGNLSKAVELARQTYQQALAIGDFSSTGISLSVWSKASQGQVPAEAIAVERQRALGDVHTSAEVLAAEAIRLLHAGQAEAAVTVLEQAHRAVTTAGLRQEYVAPILPWLLTALRRAAEEQDPLGPRYHTYMTRAHKLWRAAYRQSRHYRNNLPHTLREGAYLAIWCGRPRLAYRYLTMSLKEAAQQKARYEHGLSLALKGRLGLLYHWPEAQMEATQAEQALRSMEPPHSSSAHDRRESDPRLELSVIARFETLLQEGRNIVTSLNRDAILSALHETADKFFRGERCLIVDTASTLVIAGETKEPYSQSLIKQALAQRTAIAIDESNHQDAGDSLLLANVRTALCVPIFVHKAPLYCLYVSHRMVGRLFSGDELNLAQYLGVMTGAALENAQRYTQLETVNESLVLQAAERKRVADELLVAKNAAEAANRTKTHFLANMSHEIRTPLNAIMGFSQLLNTPELTPEEAQNFIATIDRNGRALSQLIDDILDLAKVEAGHLQLEQQRFSLGDLMRDVTASLSVQAQAKGIHLDLIREGVLPATITSDPTRLRQILLNIVGNAIKFTETGGVKLSVHLKYDGGRSPRICFTVEDSGIGIATEAQAQLFQPFTQADASTTRQFGGTGLGLVLSRRLAQALGGDLTLVASTPHIGSTFAIEIDGGSPYVQGEAQSKKAAPGQAVSLSSPGPGHPPPTPPSLEGMSILVAEDSLDNQALVRRLLHRSGAQVDLVCNGQEAVDQAKIKDYDLILMDMQMPILDGYDATTLLRANGYKGPILALTAHAMPEERERCFRAGCNGHLAKPIIASLLIKEINNYRNL